MTLDEYQYEMNNIDEILKKQPSMTDFNDPLYCRKYAHNIPPLDSLRCKPLGWDHVNIKGNDNYRKVYFGWNNISQYEKDGIANVKRWLKE